MCVKTRHDTIFLLYYTILKYFVTLLYNNTRLEFIWKSRNSENTIILRVKASYTANNFVHVVFLVPAFSCSQKYST